MISLINNRSIIKVLGIDAKQFLQSQFSNDINLISNNQVQINAYCQHQGKIIAIIWVIKRDDHYFLSIPQDLKAIVLSKLNMFKLMSNVDIEDFSTKVNLYGLIDESVDDALILKNNLSILFTTERLTDTHNISYWEKACVDNLLPEIQLDMSVKFIPQTLNLDINHIGVSFNKGCYPGQEVVARMHYLGNPKRRLFRFISKSEVVIGDSLNVNNSDSLKSSGQVIRVSRDENEFHFLGTLEVGHIHDQIFLNNDHNQLVNLIHE